MEVKDYLPKKIRDKVENIVVEADFDYDKNRSVQHYFVYLTSGERFDATTIKELKEKARQINYRFHLTNKEILGLEWLLWIN